MRMRRDDTDIEASPISSPACSHNGTSQRSGLSFCSIIAHNQFIQHCFQDPRLKTFKTPTDLKTPAKKRN